VLTGRVTGWGALLDAVCDRCGDVALVASLALLVHGSGDDVVREAFAAPAALAVVLPLLLEYVRARAGALRMPGLELVTVGERPTRLILVLMFALATGVTGQRVWALAGLSLVAASALAGLVALLWRLRRLAG
jgi:CDP-diacylglycerol--glycerol-3-phosphate 3-phosphatidyltransferase